MTDFLLQTGISNAVFSLVLAGLAVAVTAITRRPQLGYLLWLLVFVKLLTPPLLSMPVELASWQSLAGNTAELAAPVVYTGADFVPGADLAPGTPLPEELLTKTGEAPLLGLLAWARTWVPLVLLAGSLIGLIWSLSHVLRFNRMLARDAEKAPRELQVAAEDISRRLGLGRVPVVYTTAARLSPMVWWVKGQVSVVIPEQLLSVMDVRQYQWILAHEVAHIRRRDYMVRWLEWLGVILFWWNPVAWWAQRNLRATEEICCDALVLESLNPQPRTYAKSLLSVVEFLAYPALRPPAMASEINGGGFFLRRCKMIVTEQPKRFNQRWIQFFVLLVAVVVLPLGAHLYAKEKPKAKEPLPTKSGEQVIKMAADHSTDEYLKEAELKLQEQVKAGELTEAEAAAKLDFIKYSLQAKVYLDDMLKAQDKMHRALADYKLALGEISKDDMAAMEKKLAKKIQAEADGNQDIYVKLSEKWEKMEILTAKGMITFPDAVDEYLQAKQEILNGIEQHPKSVEYFQNYIDKYTDMVKAGEMTHTEALLNLRALEMAIFTKEFMNAQRKYQEESVKFSLQAMVERGEVTQEEADAKLKAWKAEQEQYVPEGETPPSKTPKEGETPPSKTPKEGEAPPKKPLKESK